MNVLEFYNDGPGLLAPLAARLVGGALSFEVAVSPDQIGLPEPTGTFTGNDFSLGALPSVTLDFPAGGQVLLLTLDDEGFPADVPFLVVSQTVELFQDDTLVLSGRLFGSMRHFID